MSTVPVHEHPLKKTTRENTTMRSLTWPWITLFALMLLPLLVLGGFGLVMLYQLEWLLYWLAGSGLVFATGLLVLKIYRHKNVRSIQSRIDENENWGPKEQEAWVKVVELTENRDLKDLTLESMDDLWREVQQVMQTVSRHYYPKIKDPVWEMPVPYLLKVIELAAGDMRKIMLEQVPGSHVLTINDVMRGVRLKSLAQEIYHFYRLVTFALNPAAALLREAEGFFAGKLMDSASGDLKLWLMEAFIKKVGFYSIELYSGTLVLEDYGLKHYVSKASQQAAKKHDQREQLLASEPLRILVLGQVKAGKSSLINALFGQMKALVDVLPETSQVTAYVLEREGMQKAVVLDTAGYQEVDLPLASLLKAKKEVDRCDLILMVCAANHSARQADHDLLKALRSHFEKQHKRMPPLMVALTFIDRLRPFREWNPPYNVMLPQSAKEQSIREAMDVVAQSLGLELAQVVPVCLKENEFYNVDDGLIPAIMQRFDESQKQKYLRCLKEFKEEEFWNSLLEQTRGAGRLILENSGKLLRNTVRVLDEVTDKKNKNK